ncbi:MAG: MptD family putative ECF transporter S component [Tissierellia bacterium]|nr:MptD family putative ECF transporter S component [Tissierellia bacterium]
MNEKLKIKDLVLVAAFALLGVVLMYIIPMPFLFTPYTVLISPILQGLFLSIPFFLAGAKVPKRWAMLIYCAIWGIGGIMPYYIAIMVIAGIIAEMLIKNSEDRAKGLTISFVVAMLCHYIGGTIIPYIFTKEQSMAMIEQMYGADYAAKMADLKTVPFMIIVAILVVIFAFIGSKIAKNFLKRHF